MKDNRQLSLLHIVAWICALLAPSFVRGDDPSSRDYYLKGKGALVDGAESLARSMGIQSTNKVSRRHFLGLRETKVLLLRTTPEMWERLLAGLDPESRSRLKAEEIRQVFLEIARENYADANWIVTDRTDGLDTSFLRDARGYVSAYQPTLPGLEHTARPQLAGAVVVPTGGGAPDDEILAYLAPRSAIFDLMLAAREDELRSVLARYAPIDRGGFRLLLVLNEEAGFERPLGSEER